MAKSLHSESTMSDVTTLLTRLVAFDTTSSASNLALIEFVEAYLTKAGVASERVSCHPRGGLGRNFRSCSGGTGRQGPSAALEAAARRAMQDAAPRSTAWNGLRKRFTIMIFGESGY